MLDHSWPCGLKVRYEDVRLTIIFQISRTSRSYCPGAAVPNDNVIAASPFSPASNSCSVRSQTDAAFVVAGGQRFSCHHLSEKRPRKGKELRPPDSSPLFCLGRATLFSFCFIFSSSASSGLGVVPLLIEGDNDDVLCSFAKYVFDILRIFLYFVPKCNFCILL